MQIKHTRQQFLAQVNLLTSNHSMWKKWFFPFRHHSCDSQKSLWDFSQQKVFIASVRCWIHFSSILKIFLIFLLRVLVLKNSVSTLLTEDLSFRAYLSFGFSQSVVRPKLRFWELLPSTEAILSRLAIFSLRPDHLESILSVVTFVVMVGLELELEALVNLVESTGFWLFRQPLMFPACLPSKNNSLSFWLFIKQ